MSTISIAMPAYNVEKYIEDAIKAIIKQTFTDWELIICDDCSKDNTVSIVEKYQKEHFNIKLIKRSSNSGGCRLPRFDAILAAQGEFVCSIDSDDIIEETYLEKLINRQKETNTEIVLSTMIICNEDLKPRKTTIPIESYDTTKIMSGKEAIKETIGNWEISMNGLVARTELYKNYINLAYDSSYNGGFADEIDHRKLLLNAKNVSISNAKYFYRQQPNSIVHTDSASSYKSLIANRILLDFVINVFKDDNHILYKMYDEYLEKIYRAQQKFYLNNHKYTNIERHEIEKLIKETYSLIKERKLSFKNKRNKLLSISFNIFKLYTWSISTIIKIKS